jgi:hypothetical protein
MPVDMYDYLLFCPGIQGGSAEAIMPRRIDFFISTEMDQARAAVARHRRRCYRWQSSSALMRHRCQVSVDEGFKWAKECRIKLGKDKSYSLFGIFNVQMPLLCDEGIQEP